MYGKLFAEFQFANTVHKNGQTMGERAIEFATFAARSRSLDTFCLDRLFGLYGVDTSVHDSNTHHLGDDARGHVSRSNNCEPQKR